jgi:hypothetical protein
LLCDPPAFAPYPRDPFVWRPLVVMYLSWRFTTLASQPVTIDQPDTFVAGTQNTQFIQLDIGWSAGQWYVTLPGQPREQDPFSSNNPACDAASNDVALLVSSVTPGDGETRIIPTASFATGCLVGLTPLPNTSATSTPTPTPSSQSPAYFIERFGVLLAVNPAAHLRCPFIPVAGPYVQQFTAQLMSS